MLYKLHREPGIPLVPLPELRMLVIDFLLKNRGQSEQQSNSGIKRSAERYDRKRLHA
jgi:hypothetical protein